MLGRLLFIYFHSLTFFMVAESTTHRLTLKKVLHHPLTWIALGVHVVLLVVPFNPSEPKTGEDSTEQSEEIESIPVDVLNLAEIATSEPPPSEPAAPPSPSSAPAIAPPRPASAPAAPVPGGVEPGPVVQSPAPASSTNSSTQTQSAAGTQMAAYDSSADQQMYIQNLDSLGLQGYKDPLTGGNALPAPREFRKGTDSSFFVAETSVGGVPTSQAVAGARDARRLDGEPADILAKQTEVYSSAGLSFVEAGSYGGEPLHQLTKADGNVVMYLSLVQLQGSTLLVIWQNDPRI